MSPLYLRSAHSNAYFYGFWKNKRIVLFDTLLEEGIMPAKEKEEESSNKADKQGGKESEGKSEYQQTGEKVKNNEQQADLSLTEEGQAPSKSDGAEAVGDNLKAKQKGCSKDEVLAVLAHELGHWKSSHNLINLTIGEVSYPIW